jgi:hypothetical protein
MEQREQSSGPAVQALQLQIKALQADCAAAHAQRAAAEARLVSVTSSYEMQLAALRHELMRLQGGAASGIIAPPTQINSQQHVFMSPASASAVDVNASSVPPPVAITPPRAATDIALALANASPTHKPAGGSPGAGGASNPFGVPSQAASASPLGQSQAQSGGKQSLSAEVERLKRSVAQARAALGTQQ